MIDRATTPNAFARVLAVKPQKVLGWIASGELKALNCAEHRGGRQRGPELRIIRVAPEACRDGVHAQPAQGPGHV